MSYHNALQQMLASVYTGFRFSDICQFQKDVLISVSDEHISLVMKKVKRKHSIGITEPLREILNLDQRNGSLFDAKIYTHSTMNKKMRKILEILSINKYMS